VTTPTILVVNISSPFQSLSEFLAEARIRPGTLSVASTGPASGFQVAVEVLKHAADVNLTYVPYPGGNQAVNALLGEHVTAVAVNYVDVMEHVKSGKVRPLAILCRDTAGLLPDVPTIADLGYKGHRSYNLERRRSTRKDTDTDYPVPQCAVHLGTCRARYQGKARFSRHVSGVDVQWRFRCVPQKPV
jgi:tripartite-type tricarboxylate transporter receptor subunit TctC